MQIPRNRPDPAASNLHPTIKVFRGTGTGTGTGTGQNPLQPDPVNQRSVVQLLISPFPVSGDGVRRQAAPAFTAGRPTGTATPPREEVVCTGTALPVPSGGANQTPNPPEGTDRRFPTHPPPTHELPSVSRPASATPAAVTERDSRTGRGLLRGCWNAALDRGCWCWRSAAWSSGGGARGHRCSGLA